MTDAIERTLAALRVPGHVIDTSTGPRTIRYVVRPVEGIRVARIVRAAPDLALALNVERVRMDLTGSGVIVEVPRDDPEPVPLSAVMAEATWPDSPLAFAVGRDTDGLPVVADLARMPHLLIAGATGTGKSVALNVLLVSMLARSGPSKVRLLLIDAKRVELAAYAGLPHLTRPIVTEVADAEAALTDLFT